MIPVGEILKTLEENMSNTRNFLVYTISGYSLSQLEAYIYYYDIFNNPKSPIQYELMKIDFRLTEICDSVNLALENVCERFNQVCAKVSETFEELAQAFVKPAPKHLTVIQYLDKPKDYRDKRKEIQKNVRNHRY